MNKIIEFFKNDFVSVRANLSYVYGKDIPMGIVIPYYIVIGLLSLPIALFIWLYYKIKIKLTLWSLEKRA